MGLDQFIYRESRKNYAARKELGKKLDELRKDFCDKNKKDIEDCLSKIAKLQQEQRDTDEEIIAIRNAFYARHKAYAYEDKKIANRQQRLTDKIEELAYWGKDGKILSYFEILVGPVKNCSEHVISKEQLIQASKDLNDPLIKEIVDSFDDDYIYYYYAWW